MTVLQNFSIVIVDFVKKHISKDELFGIMFCIYFMKPALPSPSESILGLSLSIRDGLWVDEVVVVLVVVLVVVFKPPTPESRLS